MESNTERRWSRLSAVGTLINIEIKEGTATGSMSGELSADGLNGVQIPVCHAVETDLSQQRCSQPS